MRFVLLLLLLTGCARNAVTGQNELHFISEEREIAMGTEIYPFSNNSKAALISSIPKSKATSKRSARSSRA